MVWKQAAGDATRRDPMQEFADKIVASLEVGVKPWIQPWDAMKCDGLQGPFNPTTRARYHGINILILGMSVLAFQTGDPRWCTYQQAREKGCHVRKGERATTIFFTKRYTVKDEEAEEGEKSIKILKHYAVFHASQIEGMPPYTPPGIEDAPWRRPEAADLILKNSGAVVRLGGDKAFYSPSTDHIQLPPENAFRGPPEWAATALHELAHWTGHATRLNRDMSKRFGSAGYAMEELRAELSSAFIAGELGIPADVPQHASYIAGWLKPLKSGKREIFRAAADAQRIADMVLAFHPHFAAQPRRPDGHLVESPPREPFIV
jgi:antirestriction protein ArdC